MSPERAFQLLNLVVLPWWGVWFLAPRSRAATSSGPVISAPSSLAKGSTWGRAFSFSQVMARSAPASRKARAQP